VQARRDANVIVGVCAPRDSKVRPTVVANIALSLAQERQRVLLLDAAAGDGFPASEIVSRGISSEPLSRSATFTFPGGGVLTVLRYESSAANAETDELVADHEVVLLDIPRRLSGETALGLATVDRAVVVVEADSSIDSAELLASDLRSLGAHVIGYVYARPSEKKHKNNGNGKRSDGREGLNGSRRELGSGEPPA
jgi:Mrp family chromosome partitioning ATPase